MKKIIYSFIMFLTISCFVSCDDVNSMHDKYMVNGEDFLVGKLDSIHVYGGDQRAKLVVWDGDFRATKFLVLRTDTALNYNFNFNTTNRKDSMVYYVEKLKEGTNVLQMYTWNADSTIHSIVMSKTVTVWGNKYRKFLINRKIVSAKANLLLKSFTITWDASNVVEPVLGKYAIGHQVSYKTIAGNDTVLTDIYNSLTLSTPTVTTQLPKYNTSFSFKYRMLYLPTATCIDTFKTTYQTYP